MVVRVFNGRGQVLAGAVVTEDVMPGVVQLATGAWYDPANAASPGSAVEKHGNPNVLTIDKGTSRLATGPSAHHCLVDVETWLDDLPEVPDFRTPATAWGPEEPHLRDRTWRQREPSTTTGSQEAKRHPHN